MTKSDPKLYKADSEPPSSDNSIGGGGATKVVHMSESAVAKLMSQPERARGNPTPRMDHASPTVRRSAASGTDSTELPSFVSDDDETDPTVLNETARAMNDEAARKLRAATLNQALAARGIGPRSDDLTAPDLRHHLPSGVLPPQVEIPTLAPPALPVAAPLLPVHAPVALSAPPLPIRLSAPPQASPPEPNRPPDFLGRAIYGPPRSAVPYAIGAAIVVGLVALWWLLSLIG